MYELSLFIYFVLVIFNIANTVQILNCYCTSYESINYNYIFLYTMLLIAMCNRMPTVVNNWIKKWQYHRNGTYTGNHIHIRVPRWQTMNAINYQHLLIIPMNNNIPRKKDLTRKWKLHHDRAYPEIINFVTEFLAYSKI